MGFERLERVPFRGIPPSEGKCECSMVFVKCLSVVLKSSNIWGSPWCNEWVKNTPRVWSTTYCKVQEGGWNHFHIDELKSRTRCAHQDVVMSRQGVDFKMSTRNKRHGAML